ncbi:MAG: hypothetical protein IJP00_06010 [Firmicutes bacterium]|nr:hypothetical protein [Bacillota bacterium]
MNSKKLTILLYISAGCLTVLSIIVNIGFLGGTTSADYDNIIMSVSTYALWVFAINRIIVQSPNPKQSSINVTVCVVAMVIGSLLFEPFAIVTYLPFIGIVMSLIPYANSAVIFILIYASYIGAAWVSFLWTKFRSSNN